MTDAHIDIDGPAANALARGLLGSAGVQPPAVYDVSVSFTDETGTHVNITARGERAGTAVDALLAGIDFGAYPLTSLAVDADTDPAVDADAADDDDQTAAWVPPTPRDVSQRYDGLTLTPTEFEAGVRSGDARDADADDRPDDEPRLTGSAYRSERDVDSAINDGTQGGEDADDDTDAEADAAAAAGDLTCECGYDADTKHELWGHYRSCPHYGEDTQPDPGDDDDDADGDPDDGDPSPGYAREWMRASDDPSQGDVDTSLRPVEPHSSHFDVLTAVASLTSPGSAGAVGSGTVRDKAHDVTGEMVSESLLDLYRRQLLERRWTDAGYVYRVTGHGRAEVEQHGEYEPGDLHLPQAAADYGDINPGGSIHETMTVVARLGTAADPADQWVETSDVADALRDAAAASAQPSMPKLLGAGMVQRRHVALDTGGRRYQHRLTAAGAQYLRHHGLHDAHADADVHLSDFAGNDPDTPLVRDETEGDDGT